MSDEDAKLVTLARAARTRSLVRGRDLPKAGAAIRDRMGRTFAAGTVDRMAMSLDALALAVAMAATSGADGAECAVVVVDETDVPQRGDDGLPSSFAMGVRALAEQAGARVPIWWCDSSGTVWAQTQA